MTKKSYLFVSTFSSLLFVVILVFSAENKASAESLCSNMGCLWDETNCELKPSNPNECNVGCVYMEGLSCAIESSTECNSTTCGRH